jgi:hypothetical protein
MNIEEILQRVEAGEAITRADANAVVRLCERRCRGNTLVPPEIQKKYFAFLADPTIDTHTLFSAFLNEDFEGAADVRTYAQTRLAVRGRDDVRSALIDALRARAADVGQGCGYDFNDIVCAGPFDGREYPFVCPQCGVEGTYRAPRFVLNG